MSPQNDTLPPDQVAKKKRKTTDFSARLCVTYNLAPMALRMKAYEKFFHSYVQLYNQGATKELSQFVHDHFLDDARNIHQFWRQSDLPSSPGHNPLGMLNYIDLHGRGDFIRHLERLTACVPDGWLMISDVKSQTDVTTRSAVAFAQARLVGTLVAMLPLDPHDQAVQPLVIESADSLDDTTPIPALSQRSVAREAIESVRQALCLADFFHGGGHMPTHPLSRRLTDPPVEGGGAGEREEDREGEESVSSSVGAPERSWSQQAIPMPMDPLTLCIAETMVGLRRHWLPATPPVKSPAPSPTPIRATVEATAKDECIGVRVDHDDAVQSFPRKLVAIPLDIQGLLVFRFKNYEVAQVFQGEFHYYES